MGLFEKKGKISPSFLLNLIGIFISLAGIALVSITLNPVLEIIGGVIVAVGVAMIALSKHLA